MRKRYRLIKDSLEIRVGAVFAEMCDDGTQDFQLLDKEIYFKGNAKAFASWTLERPLVENNPDWFERVFTLSELNFTQAQMDKLQKFLKDEGLIASEKLTDGANPNKIEE